jgi:methionyl-tRNA formyltransferase
MTVAGKVFKIFKVSAVKSSESFERPDDARTPGDVHTDNKNYIHIKTADGWVALQEIQPEGKKRMTVLEFFRGNKLVV